MGLQTSACGDTWTEEEKEKPLILPAQLVAMMREFSLDSKTGNLTICYKQGAIKGYKLEEHHNF